MKYVLSLFVLCFVLVGTLAFAFNTAHACDDENPADTCTELKPQWLD